MGTHTFNGPYTGEYTERIAFPLGGIGAGMIGLEGTGGFSHTSIRNNPRVFFAPRIFAALCVKGYQDAARILEAQVPTWKWFGPSSTENGQAGTPSGAGGRNYGLPHFESATFEARFPFATVDLEHPAVPLQVRITGWSPFIPGDTDNSSLPAVSVEYRFINPTNETIESVFSFHTQNFLETDHFDVRGTRRTDGGFILWKNGTEEAPWTQGAFSATVDEPNVTVDCNWFRGGWFDPITMLWKDVKEGNTPERPEITEGDPSKGGSLYVPFTLQPGEEKTIRVLMSWYCPLSQHRHGADPEESFCGAGCNCKAKKPEPAILPRHKPWYAGRFNDIEEVIAYWRANETMLRAKSERFRDTFYASTLPAEVLEAVSANLGIIKSPTVLRQTDGRLWCYEGCNEVSGCCDGSCTHVWNYAQAIPHLFPDMERSLRLTEFFEGQDERGHQGFRMPLPIRPLLKHDFHAAADGELGGMMKVYRDWRISGDTDWLRMMWPRVKQAMLYCIETWDPDQKGIVEEPHHNTYDIEFWGPDGMCTSFYLGALLATKEMAEEMGEDATLFAELAAKSREQLETSLYDGEYFIQKIQWEGLRAPSPTDPSTKTFGGKYSTEAVALLQKEGPKYQYGTGCLSDGVLGAWMAAVSGLGTIMDEEKLKSHLLAVYKYNLKHDLSSHANPQRPSYALGHEGGLLLCSWPKGGALSLPFVYSDEVWTGIEYQVASHLILLGCVEEGLDIVRTARARYDGRIRNPYNEYECGSWYGRALSSYGLLQSFSGARYDAVDKVLYIEQPRLQGDFQVFLATETGYGLVGVKDGQPFLDVREGEIPVTRIEYRP